MYKNTAGQYIFASVVDSSDGSAKTTGVDFYLTQDNGSQAAVNSAAHVGNGQWRIDLTQAETNADVIGLCWAGTDVVPGGITVYPVETKTQDYQTELGRLDAAITSRLAAADVPDNFGNLAITETTGKVTVGNVNDCKADVSGLATKEDVAAITQAQRVRIVAPRAMERPDDSSTTYRLWIYSYDSQHKALDLDSNPAVSAQNNAGQDRSANLGTVVKPAETTGVYYVDYTVSTDHAIEGIVIKVDATEGGDTTRYSEAVLIVDTTAVDFTAADRAKLDALYDKRPSGSIADQTTAEAVKAQTDQLDFSGSGSMLKSESTNMRGTDGAYTGTPPTVNDIVAGIEVEQGKLHETLSRAEHADELLRELTEDDSQGDARLTAKSLEQAPTGDSVWSDQQRDAVLALAAATEISESRINTATTPWRLELLAGQTVVKAYACYAADGEPVTDTETTIAKYVEVDL